MTQPPKFFLEANWICECNGCQRGVKYGARKFQKYIENTYGLQRSSFNAVSRTVEIVGDVEASKMEELQELLQEFVKDSVNNTTSCGCFGGSKKKKSTASQAKLNEHLKNLSIDNNNANNVNCKPENDGRKDQTEANHHHHHQQQRRQQQQQQQQHPDAKSKGKGKMGEDGNGSKRDKEIKLGGRSENTNRRGESSQKGQYPVEQTTYESNQVGQVSQSSRGENAVYDQNEQRAQNAGGYRETHYGQTYHTNMHYPMSTQMDQMKGGYNRQPATVAQISPFSDMPTADGSDCCIM